MPRPRLLPQHAYSYSYSLSLFLSLSLSLVLSPSVARADTPPPTAPPSSTASTSSSPAQDHYTAGRENYRLGLFGRALEEFERSLSLAPSPNTRLYMARTLRELGRWSEAGDQYALTIREAEQRGGRYVATRDAANVELADVKVRLERATSGAEKTTSDKPALAEAASDPATPQSTASGARTSSTSALAPAPSAEPRRSLPATTGISGGIAVAGTASFAILYALSSNRFGYLEDNCTRVRSSACDDARTTGKAEEIGAYVSLGVAALAAAVAVYSFMTAPPAITSASAQPRRAPWRLAF
jgi:tetratricopeptide (TPR) repeat protein